MLTRARLDVETTIAARPRDYGARLGAAEFYMRLGAFKDAVRHLEVARELEPKEMLPWLAIADAATLSGDFKQAKAALDRADKLDPHHPLIYRSRGQLLLRQEKQSAARKVLEEGLRRHPDDVELRTALGNVYLIVNEIPKAVATLKPAVAAQPNRPDLHYLLAEALERDLHMEAAIEELRESVRLDPSMHEAWGRMALYLVNLTRYNEARAAAERALALDPSVSHYHWVLGDAYLLDTGPAGDVDQALNLYRKAIQLDPNNDRALYSLSMALTRHGKKPELEEAVGHLRKLIEINERDPNARYKLAETLRRLGRTEEAARETARFEQLSKADREAVKNRSRSLAFPDSAEAHTAIGRRHLKAKQWEQAAREFQIALDREPGHAAAREGLREASRRLRDQ